MPPSRSDQTSRTPPVPAPARRRDGAARRRAVAAVVLLLAAVALYAVWRAGPGARNATDPAATVVGSSRVVAGAPAVEVPDAAVTTVADGLGTPAAIALRPDGTALVAERDTGRILTVAPDGGISEAYRLNDAVAGTEAGVRGLALAPTDGTVHVFYTTAADNRVVRLRPDGAAEPVVTGIPRGADRNGGAIAFGPDGMLYIGTGDAGEPRAAQDRGSLAGKVLRVTPDGAPASDNPVPGSVVYSYGHGNPRGLAWYGQADLFLAEAGHGQVDELNLIQSNGNYGWPAIDGVGNDGRYVDPVATWLPVDASFGGLTVVGGMVYLACVTGGKLYRLWLEGTGPQTLLAGRLGPLHAVALAPDGALWVAADDRVVRLAPDALTEPPR